MQKFKKYLLYGISGLILISLISLGIMFFSPVELSAFNNQCSLPRCPSGYSLEDEYCSGTTCYGICEKEVEPYCDSYGSWRMKEITEKWDGDIDRGDYYNSPKLYMSSDKCYIAKAEARFIPSDMGSADSFKLYASGAGSSDSDCVNGKHTSTLGLREKTYGHSPGTISIYTSAKVTDYGGTSCGGFNPWWNMKGLITVTMKYREAEWIDDEVLTDKVRCTFECMSGDDKCNGNEYFECYDNSWDSQGEVMGECGVECYDGDDKCVAFDYYECSRFSWNKVGKVVGECNVECSSNYDCYGMDICIDNQCEQDPCEGVTCNDKCQNGVKYFSGVCQSSSGSCSYQTTSCPFGCAGEVCKDDPCIGVDTSDVCEGGNWKHDGRCSGGNVIYNTKDQCLYGCQNEPVGVLAILSEGGMCRSSPCDRVICNDYCSQTTKFTDGECSNGKCIYSDEIKYSEECGHIPFYKTTSFMAGISIFIIIFLLISFFIWKGNRK